ncbi:MAG: hypothetical protein IPF81_09505 [Bacteroidetes bacterium]|nr:hypothetical protein [Bacteroidota bacterium]
MHYLTPARNKALGLFVVLLLIALNASAQDGLCPKSQNKKAVKNYEEAAALFK